MSVGETSTTSVPSTGLGGAPLNLSGIVRDITYHLHFAHMTITIPFQSPSGGQGMVEARGQHANLSTRALFCRTLSLYGRNKLLVTAQEYSIYHSCPRVDSASAKMTC